MTDRHAELDAALERVITAAREHLAAVKTADGKIDDDSVWQAYVGLNNATHEYDELLLDVFGEVTPWEVDAIDPDADLDDADLDDSEPDDPHPFVVSVRQRRDYRVPSVAALLAAAEGARMSDLDSDEEEAGPVVSVGDAVLELLHSGDGTLGALDIPELEMLDGVIAIAEAGSPLDLSAYSDDDGAGPFRLAADERVVGRLDEHQLTFDEEFDDDDEEFVEEADPAPAAAEESNR